MTYQLGIDLGTTCSAAAVSRPGAPAEIVPLSADTAFVPSVAFVGPDGSLLIGADAERRAPAEPGRVARQFKRRIGDGTPLWIGGTAMTADEVAAGFVAAVVDLVSARLRPIHSAAPSRVALTHPAGWGPHRLVSLRSALAALPGRGLGDVLFVPEPRAAVLAHAAAARLDPGATIAVYDLGGGSLDAAVVRWLPDRFTVLGRPEELELGFLDFDEAVFEHVRSALGAAWDAMDPSDPVVLAGVARLRRDCVAAKEALSADTDVQIPVSLPGIDTSVRLTRADFEEAIRPAVNETVEALERTIRSTGLAANELAAVLLTGGSSRIPLVTQEASARLGRPVTVARWGIVAVGAALAASQRAGEPVGAMPTAPMVVAPSWTPQPAASTPPPPAPLPLVPPPPVAGGAGGSGIGRHRLVAVAAAAAVAAMLAIGGVALAGRPDPAGAGTGQVTDLTTSATEPPASELGVVSTTSPAWPATPAPPPSSRRANPPPPPPRRTTGTTTRTTTVVPTPTGTSTTGPSSTTTPTSAGAATGAGAATSEAGAP